MSFRDTLESEAVQDLFVGYGGIALLVEFMQAIFFRELNVVPLVADEKIVYIATLCDRLNIITELPALLDPSCLEASVLSHPVLYESWRKVIFPDLHIIIMVDAEPCSVLAHSFEQIDPTVLESFGALTLI